MLIHSLAGYLPISKGMVIRSQKFLNHEPIGNPTDKAKRLFEQGVDELIIQPADPLTGIDKQFLNVVEDISAKCCIPIVAGGSADSIDDIQQLFNAGASKILLATLALDQPDLALEILNYFGPAAIACGLEAQLMDRHFELYSKRGQHHADKKVLEFLAKSDHMNYCEYYVTAIHADGTQAGLDVNLLKTILTHTHKPVTIIGGLGSPEHCLSAFQAGGHSVASNTFFNTDPSAVTRTIEFLKEKGLRVRKQ